MAIDFEITHAVNPQLNWVWWRERFRPSFRNIIKLAGSKGGQFKIEKEFRLRFERAMLEFEKAKTGNDVNAIQDAAKKLAYVFNDLWRMADRADLANLRTGVNTCIKRCNSAANSSADIIALKKMIDAQNGGADMSRYRDDHGDRAQDWG